ncbi:HAD-IIIA family hydrolase [bacterium]|nr:HAD-IIIA family hydrolase [bacterium]
MTDIDLKYTASKIKALVMDVDGVLTDGSLTFDDNGVEYKTFSAKDGQGIVMLNKAGYLTAIISARASKVVQFRAEMLGITKVYLNKKNKLETLKEFMEEYNLQSSEIAYIGDDLPDLEILKTIGLSACPSDAVEEVRQCAKFISQKGGGKGAVRELCDLIYYSAKTR